MAYKRKSKANNTLIKAANLLNRNHLLNYTEHASIIMHINNGTARAQ